MTEQEQTASSVLRMLGAPPSLAAMRENALKLTTDKSRKRVHQQDEMQSHSISVDSYDSESAKSEKSNDASDELNPAEGVAVPPPAKKRRKKRRIRLTDHAQRAKRKADRREKLLACKKEADNMIPGAEEVEREGEITNKDKDHEHQQQLSQFSKKGIPIEQYTPFQLLCDNILRKIMAKDPEEYFLNPVDPSVAPDYYEIIEHPMDFSTIRSKIENSEYINLAEMRDDLDLIVKNATSYNESDSIYYLAAQKAVVIINYFFSEKYLTYLYYSLPFAKQLNQSQLGISVNKVTTDLEKSSRISQTTTMLEEDIDAYELLKTAEDTIKTRLTVRKAQCEIAYLDNKDGAIALNILTGPKEKSVASLGNVLRPLEIGTPGICLPSEPRICKDYPITCLEPGPFESFAPQYDSTWSTLSERDSTMLLSYYGEKRNTDELLKCYGERNVVDAISLRHFVSEAGKEALSFVDALLNVDDGEHQYSATQLETNVKERKNKGKNSDVVKMSTKEQRLHETGTMIQELKNLQYKRLSMQPSSTLTAHPPLPNNEEDTLAGKIVNQLQQQVLDSNTTPGNLISAGSVHAAFGLNDEEYELMREFLIV